MNEIEWLACADPTPMLGFLRGKASDRKMRLFAVACCRRIWHLLTDERSRRAVEVGELFADGDVDEKEVSSAKTAANAIHFDAATPDIFCSAAHAAACAFYAVTSPSILTFAAANRAAHCVGAKKESEQQEQCRLFRDIFANPFRPITLNPNWLTPNVVALAQAIYDDRAFDRLPVLADTLEETGCDDADILAHCRQVGPHVRGCWVVDLLLGKG